MREVKLSSWFEMEWYSLSEVIDSTSPMWPVWGISEVSQSILKLMTELRTESVFPENPKVH